MRQVRFVALAEGGTAIVLADEVGGQYRLAVDERVKAAARGDGPRLGQIELTMDTALRPAEIQARLRAGASPEEVARAGSTPLERVLRFAGPVLHERAAMIERARATYCRPTGNGEALRLGEAVDSRLAENGVDSESAAWDAGRREDGKWLISVRYGAGRLAGEAVWVYDPLNQHVEPDNESARTLLADATPPEPEESEASRALSVVREKPRPYPRAASTASHQPASADQPTRQVSIPSWDDIVFGIRGRKN
jgi:hypothetical protein